MSERGMSVRELADAVNDAVGRLTGRPGATSERTVYSYGIVIVLLPPGDEP